MSWATGTNTAMAVCAFGHRHDSRERLAPPPPLTWKRVRIKADCSGFLYRTREGNLVAGHTGEVIDCDSETLQIRRRDLQDV